MARTLPQDCRPRNRCHNWRECNACAAIRQARIADKAEALLKDYLQPQLIVIKPDDTSAKGMQRAIRACIRNNGLRAGIWTIERGQKAATMHINIITHGGTLKPPRGSTQHASTIRAGIRETAAYISKRQQAVQRQHYAGKTFGHWGRAADYLTAPDMAAAVQGLEAEREIGEPPAPVPPPPKGRRPEAPAPTTREQDRECAARNLPMLAAISDSFKRRKKETEKT